MFHSSILSPKITGVTVEYDGKNGRESKNFKDNSSARSFYLRKSKEGKNPKVVSAKLN